MPMFSEPFRILQNNIHGWYAHSESIHEMLIRAQPHIFAIQEAFRSHKHIIKHQINNTYKCFWGHSGRTGILCRQDIVSVPISPSPKPLDYWRDGFETVWVQVKCPNDKCFVIGSVYRNFRFGVVPTYTNNAQAHVKKSTHVFDSICLKNEIVAIQAICPNIIICGDWNAEHNAWQANTNDNVGELLYELFTDLQLCVLNQSPYTYTFHTQQGRSAIDATLVSRAFQHVITSWWIDSDEYDIGSDHLPIEVCVNIDSFVSKITCVPRVIWNIQKANWKAFQTSILHALQKWNVTYSDRLISDDLSTHEYDWIVKEWTHVVHSTARRHVGMYVTKYRGNPWFTSKLHRMKQQRNKLKRQLRRDPNNKDKEHKYLQAKRVFQRTQRQCYYAYTKRQIDNISNSPASDRFRYFKALNPKCTSVYPTLTDTDKLTTQTQTATTNLQKATLLNHFFGTPRFNDSKYSTNFRHKWRRIDKLVIKWRSKYRDKELHRDRNVTEDSLQHDITFAEVEDAIQHIDINKATGCDDIHNAFFKHGGFAIVASIHLLLASAVNIGYMPTLWKQQDILPIAKPNRDHSVCK